MVDNSGALVEHYVYDAYGQLLSVTDQNGDLVEAPRSRYLYTGRELDLDTGLEYYRGRWYDPAVNRFLSEDPIRFAAGDANLYRYVGNGPMNATDPSGLCESLTDEYVLSAQERLIGVQALIDELRPSVERFANLRPPIPGGHAGLASWQKILGDRQRLANLMWQAKGFSREMNHARARISPRPPVSKSPWKIS
ncbi:MAG: RHS repeat-associated core domain-containing protein [Singulisphaera sp.]